MSDTNKLTIDSPELFDGWDTNKYTCTYVLGQIRQLGGDGPLSKRLYESLREVYGPKSDFTHTSTPPNGNGSATIISPKEKLDLIKQADDLYKQMLADEINLAPFAEILLAQGWEGDDPTGRIEKLRPENVKSILEDRVLYGEYFSEVSQQLQFFFRSLVLNAWKTWIRKHG